MRAAITRRGRITLGDVPAPVPGTGQLLVRTLACGICGSDLHALAHLDHFAALTARASGATTIDPSMDLVFGHEFVAEVVSFGPGTERKIAPGTRVCSLPFVLGPGGVELIGYSHQFPGGLAEEMVLQEMFLQIVPDHVASEHAALTEPMAVGEHAVGRADVRPGDPCVVLGCGPVGLAVIAALKVRGCGPITAADFSATRRRLAELLGADVVVDPATGTALAGWAELGVAENPLERSALEAMGLPVKDVIIFEAIGVPGILQTIIDAAPARSRVVVVGVCMQPDEILPAIAVVKELDIRFAFGYDAGQFGVCLDRIADGAVDVAPLITAQVGVEEAAAAFEALARPDDHAKVLVVHPRP